MKRTALLSLVLVSALSLTACSGSDDPADQAPAATASSSSGSEAASADPAIVSPPLPDVPAFSVDPQGVIDDITVDSCDTAAGPVKAAGTAKNSEIGRAHV